MERETSYVVLGGGRWAGVIREVLAGTQRKTRSITEVRRKSGESDQLYRARIADSLAGSEIAWICVPPCPDLTLLMETVIEAGLHVVVEKPWMRSEAETEALAQLAEPRGVLAGVHFQYCWLDAVQDLRRELLRTDALRFSGTFTLSRPDRLRLPAIHNLGSHLFAIREYAAPNSEIVDIRCGYEMGDERQVRVETATNLDRRIELATDEPLIQRYIAAFERGVADLKFPFDLRFGARVFAAAEQFVRKFD